MSASVATWVKATRPRTLVAGFIPVAVGSALAMRDGVFHPVAAVASLVGALLIQIGTNLANDYFDFRRGADTSQRLGPMRVTQAGLIAPAAVLAGAITCFAAAFLVGLYLVAVGGWPILAIGLISILAGYCYTGGPFPLAYHGLGDVFVLVFFGFVAVGGTYFVQSHTVTYASLLAGIPVGLLGVALLSVNNTRDEATDRAANKRTLVVRFGQRFGRGEWVTAVVISYLTPLAMWLSGFATPWVLVSWLSIPLAVATGRQLWRESGAGLNAVLAATARLQLVFGALFSIGVAS